MALFERKGNLFPAIINYSEVKMHEICAFLIKLRQKVTVRWVWPVRTGDDAGRCLRSAAHPVPQVP